MGKKFVWVSEELIGELEDVDLTFENMVKIITGFQKEINTMTECVDENVVGFRYHAQKVRDDYKKVVEEELAKTYELWEQMNQLRNEASQKLQEVVGVTKTITPIIIEIKHALNNINLYGVDKLLEVTNKIAYMGDQEKELLFKLLQIEKQSV